MKKLLIALSASLVTIVSASSNAGTIPVNMVAQYIMAVTDAIATRDLACNNGYNASAYKESISTVVAGSTSDDSSQPRLILSTDRDANGNFMQYEFTTTDDNLGVVSLKISNNQFRKINKGTILNPDYQDGFFTLSSVLCQ